MSFRKGKASQYRFPPGLEHNLLWFAFRKFRPHDPIHLFEDLARRFGDIAHYKIGPENILFLNHPDFIREVLVVQNDNFVKERTVQRTKMLLGEGMITSEGKDHRQQRLAAQPAFHRQAIRGYADTMVEESERAARRWRDGEVIDASQHMMDLTLAIVSRTLFSTDLGAEVAELTESINRIMNLYHYLVLLPAVEILVQLRAPKVGRFARERAKLDQIVYRMIAEHRKSRSIRADRGGDLLDMMIAAEEDDSPETNERLRDQVTTIFLAGYETVANALTWTWYLLDQNQDAQRLLHAELDQVLKGRSPGIDDLPNLRYTEMVLAESMRLFPPAWAMGRKAIKDFDLGPYRLPAKTTVLMSQYVTHREEKFFPDPLRFDPERFSPAAKAQRPKFAYFPFGAGGRQCIGESFAWMECVLVLATLAQKWKLHLVPGHKVQPEPLITLRPKYGMRMRLEARHSRTGNDSARSAVHQRDGQPV